MYRKQKERSVEKYSQIKVSVLISAYADRKSDDNGRQTITDGIIKSHLSVIDVTHFCEHSV